ncbi:MAG: hypothetical protein ACPGLV_04490, partial [Bacteroidia bacterium]
MDRKSFVKTGCLTVLGLSLTPIVSGFNNNNNNTFSIFNKDHVRHGLLLPLEQKELKNSPFVFQVNEFNQGINS